MINSDINYLNGVVLKCSAIVSLQRVQEVHLTALYIPWRHYNSGLFCVAILADLTIWAVVRIYQFLISLTGSHQTRATLTIIDDNF